MNRDRLVWLDSLKGIAIILVVVGHVMDGYLSAGIFSDYSSVQYAIFNICYSFHMPLFFTLSGISFAAAYCSSSPCSINEIKIKRKVVNIALLYIEWTFILWGFKYVFADQVNTPWGIDRLIMMPIKSVPPYWYLYVLALCYLSVLYLRRMSLSVWSLVFSAFLSCCSYWIMSLGESYPLFQFLIYFFFFFLGVRLHRKNITCVFFNYLPWGLLILALGLGTFTSYLEDYKIQWWNNAVCGFIIASFMTISFYMLFRKFHLSIFSLLGKHCLSIYLLHCFFTALNRKVLILMGIDFYWGNIFLNVLVSIFVPIILSSLIKKTVVWNIMFSPLDAIKIFKSSFL